MEIVRRAPAMRALSRRGRANGRRIGFVPTMGALHEGHLSLIRQVRELSDISVVSIFVNPTQFDSPDDLGRYPRELTRDADLCVAEGVDYVFAPAVEDLYPPGACTWVEVEGLSSVIEGRSRTGHFRGVSTVVLKLLNVVEPHVVGFGQKDAQQALIIQQMVRDLLLDVEVLVLPVVRDEDGLALSSRNVRLSADERRAALAIPRSLEAAAQVLMGGQRLAGPIVAAATELLDRTPGVEIDYVELVDARTLTPLERVESDALLLVAARVGATRLIDNRRLRA